MTNEIEQRHSLWGSRIGIALVVFGAIAAYFLFTEHRAHVFSGIAYLLLLACPLVHVFGHGGHGAHGGRGHGAGEHNAPDHQKPKGE